MGYILYLDLKRKVSFDDIAFITNDTNVTNVTNHKKGSQFLV